MSAALPFLLLVQMLGARTLVEARDQAEEEQREAEAASREALLAAARALDAGDELVVQAESLRVVVEDARAARAAGRVRQVDWHLERIALRDVRGAA